MQQSKFYIQYIHSCIVQCTMHIVWPYVETKCSRVDFCVRGSFSWTCCQLEISVQAYVSIAVNGVQVNFTSCMSRAKLSLAPPRFQCMRRGWSLGTRLQNTCMRGSE